MSVATSVPPDALSRPVGGLVIEPGASETNVFLRVDDWDAGSLPKMCSVETVLPVWDAGEVLVAAMLVRLAREAKLTYEGWIDVGQRAGFNQVKALGRKTDLLVHIVTNQVTRTIRTPNTIYRQAMQLYRETVNRDPYWKDQQFQDARRRVTRLYPSVLDLWRLGGEDRLHSI